MKLSTRARYALRMLIEIARHSASGDAVSLRSVAKKTLISRRYLEQLVIGLKNADLIHGISGRSGGYKLARPAEQIKIGQIVEASIGQINIVDCVQQPETCLSADVCECRWVYQLINHRINEVLNEYSLADLGNKSKLKTLCREEGIYGCPTR